MMILSTQFGVIAAALTSLIWCNSIHLVKAESTIHVDPTSWTSDDRSSDIAITTPRRRAAATVHIEYNDLFNMPNVTFKGTGDETNVTIYTKIKATKRIMDCGKEQVVWYGAILEPKNQIGFATLLRHDNGDIVATFSNEEAAYELDTMPDGSQQVSSVAWTDAKMGSAIEMSKAKKVTLSKSRVDHDGLDMAGSMEPDHTGTVTSSTGKAKNLVVEDDNRRKLRSPRELQSGTVVDILVVVTNRAMCEVAGLANGCAYNSDNARPINDKIALAEQQSTAAVQGVGVSMSFRVVRIVHLQAGYDALPDVAALDTIASNANIQGWRDESGADLIAMLTGSIPSGFPAAGIAYINRPESVTSASYFSIFTFTHELGHNFGCLHDRRNSEFTHPYGHAIQVPNRFRSVMAYSCSSAEPCPVIPYFSAAGFVYSGTALGTATEDNARLIRESMAKVAAWRSAPGGPSPPVQSPVQSPVGSPPTGGNPDNGLTCAASDPNKRCASGNLMRKNRFLLFCTELCIDESNIRFRKLLGWRCGSCE